MHIGVIGSSGGAVFAEMVDILSGTSANRYQFTVLSDRACGLEHQCEMRRIPCRRIVRADNEEFSANAHHIFQEAGIEVILLFFLRLVTPTLFTQYPTFNIHPSLLPAFRGFNPIRQAHAARVRFLGVTLHLVTEQPDSGPIVAQITAPIRTSHTEPELSRISFIQKVYLSLLLVDLWDNEHLSFADEYRDVLVAPDLPYTDHCNPCLSNPEFIRAMTSLQTRQHFEGIV